MNRGVDTIRFQTFEAVHGRRHIGSTKIRVHNLVKNWDEAELYKYGEKPDVLIFQKVYATKDYKFPLTYPGIKILDVCDADWLGMGVLIKETINAMDAVVVPTEPLKVFLQTMTDKPIKVIKDRFDLMELPPRKIHRGRLKEVVWFGYHHNAVCLKLAVYSLEKRGIKLRVIADQDPFADRWATDPEAYSKMYTFKKYLPESAYKEIQKSDVCVLPKGTRPEDRFKSENKTVIAQLLGLPVAKTAEDLDELLTAEQRNSNIDTIYDKLKQDYDVQKSVEQMKGLIDEIKRT